MVGQVPRANHVTTVDMRTGEILAVAEAHSGREVRRMVRRAQRRRARNLRAAAVTSWRLAPA